MRRLCRCAFSVYVSFEHVVSIHIHRFCLVLKILDSQTFSIHTDQKTRIEVHVMHRSKLEQYEAILGALVKKPLTNDHIAYEVDVDCNVLNKHLDFLIQNGLVEDRLRGKKTFYALTDRGMTVYKTLNFRKYLEKISNTIKTLEEATDVLPIISKQNSEQESKEVDETY